MANTAVRITSLQEAAAMSAAAATDERGQLHDAILKAFSSSHGLPWPARYDRPPPAAAGSQWLVLPPDDGATAALRSAGDPTPHSSALAAAQIYCGLADSLLGAPDLALVIAGLDDSSGTVSTSADGATTTSGASSCCSGPPAPVDTLLDGSTPPSKPPQPPVLCCAGSSEARGLGALGQLDGCGELRE